MGTCWYLFWTEEVLFQRSPVCNESLRIESGDVAFRGLTWRCILQAINNDVVLKVMRMDQYTCGEKIEELIGEV